MAFTFEFIRENGELVKTFEGEQLDRPNIESIMELKVNDTITLGSGSEKKNYKVLRINRKAGSARLSGQSEDYKHIDFIVKAIPDRL